MARRATSKATGRTSQQKKTPASTATEAPVEAPSRGRKPKQREAQPVESSLGAAIFPGGDEPASQPSAGNDDTAIISTRAAQQSEPTAGSNPADDTFDDVADAAPDRALVKARRGRRPKAQLATQPDPMSAAVISMPDVSAEPPEEAVSSTPSGTTDTDVAVDIPVALPIKARRGRPRKAETAAPPPQPPAGQHGGVAVADAPTADVAKAAAPSSPGPAAARWDPATGTAKFDWPTIEQVAATDGPNQAMARLLLAARAEGANSRWPF